MHSSAVLSEALHTVKKNLHDCGHVGVDVGDSVGDADLISVAGHSINASCASQPALTSASCFAVKHRMHSALV